MPESSGGDASRQRASTPPPPRARQSSPVEPVPGTKTQVAADVGASSGKKTGLGVIYLTVFLDFFANGVVLPVLQNHAMEFGASGFNVGMVFTAYSASQIPGSFLFGRMSDSVGRRPVILISLAMSMVTMGFTMFARDLQSLIVARAIAGFFSETSVCQAYIADKTSEEKRAAAFGHMGAFIGLAFICGPATGALLGIFGGFNLAVKFTIFVTAINYIYAHARLDESMALQGTQQSTVDARQQSSSIEFTRLLRALLRPVIALVLLGQFATTLAFMGWDTTFALWAKQRLGYTQRHTGWAFAWLAVGFFIASWKTRSFAKNPANTSIGGVCGCGAMAVGLLAHRLVSSTFSALPPLFGIGFGYALSEIVFQTLVSVHSPAELQGSMLGSLSASTALARAVAPVVVGYLFDVAPEGDLDFAYSRIAAAPTAAIIVTLAAYACIPNSKRSKSD